MEINKLLNYLKNSLIFGFLTIQNLYCQIEIKINDINGNGISHCHLISSLNNLVIKSDDSGFVKIHNPILSDTFIFKHANYKTRSIFISKEVSNYIIYLNFDTIQFNDFVLVGMNCENKVFKKKKEYGISKAKKKNKFGSSVALDYKTKVAHSFILDNSCGKIEEISFFVPSYPKMNNEIKSNYNLNFYIISNDSISSIASWKLIYTLDLSNIKYGWNKININNCSFKTKQIIIGLDVTLKSNDSLSFAINSSNNSKFPIYIKTEDNGSVYSIFYTDYTLNNKFPKGWQNLNGSISIKIKTKEYELN